MLTKYFKRRFIIVIIFAILSWLYIVVKHLRYFISTGAGVMSLLDLRSDLFILPLLYFSLVVFLLFKIKKRIRFIIMIMLSLLYSGYSVYCIIEINRTLISLVNINFMSSNGKDILITQFMIEAIFVYIIPVILILVFIFYYLITKKNKHHIKTITLTKEIIE